MTRTVVATIILSAAATLPSVVLAAVILARILPPEVGAILSIANLVGTFGTATALQSFGQRTAVPIAAGWWPVFWIAVAVAKRYGAPARPHGQRIAP